MDAHVVVPAAAMVQLWQTARVAVAAAVKGLEPRLVKARVVAAAAVKELEPRLVKATVAVKELEPRLVKATVVVREPEPHLVRDVAEAAANTPTSRSFSQVLRSTKSFAVS